MKTSHKLVLSAFVALGFAALQACGGDDEQNKPTIVATGGSSSTGGKGSGSGGESDGSGGLGGADGSGGNNTGGTIIGPPPDRESCPDEADDVQPSSALNAGTACWNIKDCNGKNEEQFLNQCNGKCFPFDNAQRLPK